MARATLTSSTLFKPLVALGLAASFLYLKAGMAAEGLDRYGGLKSVCFEATGFFRVERADRWWFVTPEGWPDEN